MLISAFDALAGNSRETPTPLRKQRLITKLEGNMKDFRENSVENHIHSSGKPI